MLPARKLTPGLERRQLTQKMKRTSQKHIYKRNAAAIANNKALKLVPTVPLVPGFVTFKQASLPHGSSDH